MKNWLITLLGGYASAIDAIRDVGKRQGQQEMHDILTEAVRHLYKTIGSEDILREDEYGNWFVGDKKLEEAERKTLIQEAQFINRSFFWKIVKQEIMYKAGKRTLLRARTETDLIAGKLWIWTLDMLQTRLNAIEKGSGKIVDKETP